MVIFIIAVCQLNPSPENMNTNEMPGPSHKMATEIVAVPTVACRRMDFEDGAIESTWIQWYGQSDSPYLPKDAQFFFDTGWKPDDPIWVGDPSSFRVVFIGQIKHWPNPDAIQPLIEDSGWSPETTVVWLMSPICVSPGRPSSSIRGVVVLGDPICGVIEPRLYCDMSVRDAVMESMPIADRLLLQPETKLPPEETPWTDAWTECDCSQIFGHSYSRKPAQPPGGDCFDLSYVCPDCNRRWWQYNDYYHLWKHVTNPQEWDAIRRQQIFKDAGYDFPER